MGMATDDAPHSRTGAPIDGPRTCGPDEVQAVIRLVDAAMREGSDQTLRADYPLVYSDGNLENVSVLAADGRIVSTAPVLPRRVSGDGFAFGLGVISPTATDPAYQHRGFGAACVGRCVERMDALGLPLSVLWTRVETFPFYELHGWQAVARYGATYRVGRNEAAAFAGAGGAIGRGASSNGLRIARLDEDAERLGDVLRLRGDRPGVERTLDEAAALFSLPRMTTWLALEPDGRTAAYVVESHAVNRPGILEAGGDDRAIAHLVADVLGALAPRETIGLSTGFAPDPLAAVAESALPGVRPQPDAGNMMVRLNDPAAFLRSMRPWLARAVPRDLEAFSVHVTDAGVTISIERRPFDSRSGRERSRATSS